MRQLKNSTPIIPNNYFIDVLQQHTFYLAFCSVGCRIFVTSLAIALLDITYPNISSGYPASFIQPACLVWSSRIITTSEIEIYLIHFTILTCYIVDPFKAIPGGHHSIHLAINANGTDKEFENMLYIFSENMAKR